MVVLGKLHWLLVNISSPLLWERVHCCSRLWVWFGLLKFTLSRLLLPHPKACWVNSGRSFTPLWTNKALASWSRTPSLELPRSPCGRDKMSCTRASVRRPVYHQDCMLTFQALDKAGRQVVRHGWFIFWTI